MRFCLRTDIPEGGRYARTAFINYGYIKPFASSAPYRAYILIVLPSWMHSAEYDHEKDMLIARWRQLNLIWTATLWEHANAWDGWIATWLPTDEEPTEIWSAQYLFFAKRIGY